jgi:acyl carrier protein
MKRQDILKRLVAVISVSVSAPIDASQVTEATSLESFSVDSLALIDLIFDVEQEFGVKLSVAHLTGMRTMGDLVSHIESLTGT